MTETDRTQYVTKGDSFKLNLTAGAWNSFIDAANAYKLGEWRDVLELSRTKDRPSLIDVIPAADLNRLDIAGLDSIGIPVANREEPFSDIDRPDFATVAPTSAHRGKFAITTDGGDSTDVYEGVGAGVYVCKLQVDTNGEWIDRADVDVADATRLRAVPNGSAQILWKETGTGVVDAIVRLGNPQFVAVAGKAVGPIQAGSSTGLMEVWNNTTTQTGFTIGTGGTPGQTLDEPIFLDWMHGNLDISNDKEIIIGWFPHEGLWRVIHAECEDAEPPMVFKGDWEVSETPYTAGSTVNQYAFLMHANTTTSQDPTPSVSGTPSFTIPDGVTWGPATDAGWVYTGNQYRVTDGTVIQGWRVYVPTVGGTYRYTAVFRNITDPANPIVLSTVDISGIPGLVVGWFEEQSERYIVYADEVFEVGLIAENTAASTDHLNAPWVYFGTSQNLEPLTGTFNHTNQNDLLRIDITDDNAVDQTTALSGIVAGDVIQIYDGANRRHYAVQANLGLDTTSYGFSVQQLLQIGGLSVGNSYTVQVERSGSLTDYVELPGYWPANLPSWSDQVQGIIATSADDSGTLSDTAYGADLLQADWQVPSDWDVVAISSRTF